MGKKSPEYYRQQLQKLKAEVFTILGGKCVRCGFSDWRALQIDHINGHGNQERKWERSAGGRQFYRRILKSLKDGTGKDKYQLLCANCNWIKRRELREET